MNGMKIRFKRGVIGSYRRHKKRSLASQIKDEFSLPFTANWIPNQNCSCEAKSEYHLDINARETFDKVC